MAMTRADNHEKHLDYLECRRCLSPGDAQDLDRMLWCSKCRAASRRSAGRWGRVVGLATGLGLALWAALYVGPSDRFLIFWLAAIVISYRLVARLGQELFYGVMRIRNRPGVAAVGGQTGE